MAAQFSSFTITNAGGVMAYAAVVADTTGKGLCKIPTVANSKGFLGIVTDDQPNQNQSVSVQMTEDTQANAAGAIAVGDLVNIANNLGQLQSCQATVDSGTTTGVLYVVGQAIDSAAMAGDVFRFEIRPTVIALEAA